jgi:hypothetical protein
VALVYAGTDEPPEIVAPETLDEAAAAEVERVRARMSLNTATLPWELNPADEEALREHADFIPRSLRPPEWLDALAFDVALRLVGLLRGRLGPDLPLDRLIGKVTSRPAKIARTPTHVDVYMHNDTVDLDLRRVALDVDPGWVPFLARVVRFHYL